MTVKIRIPPVFGIRERLNGNTIHQIVEPQALIEADLASYSSGKIKGQLITRASGENEILVIETGNVPSDSFFGILKAKTTRTLDKSEKIDFSDADWIRHPMLPSSSSEPN